MKKVLPVLLCLTVSCGHKIDNPDTPISPEPSYKPPVSSTYSNPVCHMSLPDPTVIRVDDVFYLYATEDTRNNPIMVSSNLVTWKQCGTVFTESTRPTFVDGGGIWAPDINKIGNRYVLYYSMSVWGECWECGIGIAVSEDPAGPWTNRGKLFISSEIGVFNSIDPFYIEDNGKKYLFWGSYGGGIWAIELSDDGLSLKDGAKKVQVAGPEYEGSYIHKKGRYYYLFASMNNCCNGFDSIYKTVVGRSKSLLGPYVDKAGRDMMKINQEVLIEGDGINFFGTGHNSEIITDDNGDDWIMYHSYTKQTGKNVRALMLDKVEWENGWPKVGYGYPSKTADRPVFKR